MEQKPHQSPNVRVQSLSKCQKQLRAWQTGGVHVRLMDPNRDHLMDPLWDRPMDPLEAILGGSIKAIPDI